MSLENSGYSIKLAWQTALITRGCPPDSILFSATPSPETREKHIQGCPFCQERLEHKDLYAGIDQSEISLEEKKSDAKQKIRPGQIRLVNPDLGGWGPRNRYYNSPNVLVLKLLPEPAAAVEVAQVHTQELLSGPGDVQLKDQGFAQSWNTYTLAVRDLGRIQGIASTDLTEQVRAFSRNEPEPISENRVLFYFRQLELSVGSCIASRSINGLLADQEADQGQSPPEAIQDLDPRDLRRQFRTKQPELILPEKVSSALELAGLASFQDRAFAAADTRQAVEAKWLTPKEQGPEISPAQVAVTLMERTTTQCTLAGRILPAGIQAGRVHAWWQAEGNVRPAEKSLLSPDGHYFHVQFADLPEPLRGKEKISLLFSPHA